MKSTNILQTVSFIAIAALAVSCSSNRSVYEKRYPGRSYPYYEQYPHNRDPNPYNLPPGQAKKVYGSQSAKVYAPGQRKKHDNNYRSYPLIIIRTPDIVIRRYNDGRYYYFSPEGLTYWKGNDDRFYLDDRYLAKINYDKYQYDEWEKRGKNNAKNVQPKSKYGKHSNGKSNRKF